MHVESTPVTRINDQPVFKIFIKNDNNLSVLITNYGCIIMKICTPDLQGRSENIVAGFERVEDYQSDHPYFGAVIGRYANRISKGKFTLQHETYHLLINNGVNHLHGGPEGFHRKVWEVKNIIHDANEAGVELHYVSKDGEENYPGTLDVTVKYLLNNANELSVSYTANTDKATIINLTNHSYFNLSAFKEKTIRNHWLQINALKYLPVDETLIPTGERKSVADTAFDFIQPKKIGEDIERTEGGYDHNFILREINSSEMIQVAGVKHEASGRVLDVFSDQPGVQFYSGNFLDGTITGVHGAYEKHGAFCLETQHWPDSPNQVSFPSVTLSQGETFYSKTIYRFSVASA